MTPAFIVLYALLALSWLTLIPLLREPRPRVVPPRIAFDVPNYTFDPRGFS